MTNFELRKQYPNHWFVKVVGHGHHALLVIKKNPEKIDRPIAGMPGMTIDLLSGATITLRGEGAHVG